MYKRGSKMINETIFLLMLLLAIPLLGLISLPFLVERTARVELLTVEPNEAYKHKLTSK